MWPVRRSLKHCAKKKRERRGEQSAQHVVVGNRLVEGVWKARVETGGRRRVEGTSTPPTHTYYPVGALECVAQHGLCLRPG